jgi:hypothetical protein
VVLYILIALENKHDKHDREFGRAFFSLFWPDIWLPLLFKRFLWTLDTSRTVILHAKTQYPGVSNGIKKTGFQLEGCDRCCLCKIRRPALRRSVLRARAPSLLRQVVTKKLSKLDYSRSLLVAVGCSVTIDGERKKSRGRSRG